MENETVKQAVVRAVQQAFDDWAAEHPSLAAVIDRISLAETAAESLRASPEYEAALAGYHKSRSELEFLSRLVELASPIVRSLLGT